MWIANLNFIKWLDASHAIDASAEMSQHEETIRGFTGALGESSKLGWSLRYQLRRRLRKAVVHQWLPACARGTDLALLVDLLLLCFQRYPRHQPNNFFCLPLSWVYTVGFNRVPRSSTKSEANCCPANTGLLCLLVSGGGRVGRDAVSHLEFPVWVLGRLLRDSDLN